ncbi:hypothetical protein DY000_02041106 [Brassica cretica]|uniref:Chromo domain-containing protein n=1 Tax=Brassica cretica TaxID=69181 RepID=A0ABQ7B8L8_BRACR|nr:hypothetical protein DY000_02041106 [Brassica cretica]
MRNAGTERGGVVSCWHHQGLLEFSSLEYLSKFSSLLSFQVSSRKCMSCHLHVVLVFGLLAQRKPVEVSEIKNMDVQGKKTNMIRVCWEKDGIREETWEPESHMRSSYPGLFPSVLIPTDVDVNSRADSCLVGESCHNLGTV